MLAPYLEKAHRRQRVAIAVNGGAPTQFVFNGDSGPRTLNLALPTLKPGAMMALVIEIPDAVLPQQLGINSDARRLGVNVRTLSFEQQPE